MTVWGYSITSRNHHQADNPPGCGRDPHLPEQTLCAQPEDGLSAGDFTCVNLEICQQPSVSRSVSRSRPLLRQEQQLQQQRRRRSHADSLHGSKTDMSIKDGNDSMVLPVLLSRLHQHCQDVHGGNLSASDITTTTPSSSSTEEGEGAGAGADTDFGAVMYITAVLVFYSLGIVVMIVKYLKTERKEMEEEMALDSFFKGIPSKKIEHNREAVNRVAIRAFHTLTSAAARKDQLLKASANHNNDSGGGKPEPGSCYDTSIDVYNELGGSGSGVGREDRDWSLSSSSLQRDRSRYLPRVSLMFRDARYADRRQLHQDSLRSQRGLAFRDDTGHDSLGERSPSPSSASRVVGGKDDGGGGQSAPEEDWDRSSDSSVSSHSLNTQRKKAHLNKVRNENGVVRGTGGVRFKDGSLDCLEERGRPTGEQLTARLYTAGKAVHTSPSPQHGESETSDRDLSSSSIPYTKYTCNNDSMDRESGNEFDTDANDRSISYSSAHSRSGDPNTGLPRGDGSGPITMRGGQDVTEGERGSTEGGCEGSGHPTVIVIPGSGQQGSPRRLLVSDV